MKRKETHCRKKINPEDADEVIENAFERTIDTNANSLIKFAERIILERGILSTAISTAKISCGLDIDAAVDNNKQRQRLASVLDRLCTIKGSNHISRGTSYKFNADGNQVSYNYNVETVETIDFDRNKAHGISKELKQDANKVSNEIDRCLIETQVDYNIPWDVNDSFEDVLAEFSK